MTDVDPAVAPPRARPGSPIWRGASWTVAIVVIAAAAFAAMSIVTCAYHFATGGDSSTTTTVVRPTPQVVVAVRDLARLESAEYHMERVIDLEDRQTRFFGLVEAEDAILLIASGEVTAGVDLTRMQDGDVVVDPDARTARITLPEPEVLRTTLDNERTYVHHRSTDTLAQRSETLETRARQEAERTLHDAAVEAGILDRARDNARRTVTTLVESLGYDDVQVQFAGEAD
jgi:hypothetical protein